MNRKGPLLLLQPCRLPIVYAYALLFEVMNRKPRPYRNISFNVNQSADYLVTPESQVLANPSDYDVKCSFLLNFTPRMVRDILANPSDYDVKRSSLLNFTPRMVWDTVKFLLSNFRDTSAGLYGIQYDPRAYRSSHSTLEFIF